MSLTPKEFQQLLIDHGFSCGPYGADGYWGERTAGACEGWFNTGIDLSVPAEPPIPSDSIVPAGWLPDCEMHYVTLHWTAGVYTASDHDKQFYHILIEADGTLVRGDHPISDNVSTADDNYAAHTASANSYNIGISCCAMAGAVEGGDLGKYPLTKKQWLMAAKVAAELGAKYNIAPERTRMLSHGEWQSTMGVPQSGKFDINVLPWSPGLDKSEVNDLWRSIVKEFGAG